MYRIVKPNQMAVMAGKEVLKAMALGSSLGICMYDGKKKIGGMAHTLLPGGVLGRGGLCCVDTAAELLYEAMIGAGANREDIRVKLVGGARLFSFQGQSPGEDVGRQNVAQAHRIMQKLSVPIVSEDTGENYGRTVYFYLEDGRLEIETAGRSRYTI